MGVTFFFIPTTNHNIRVLFYKNSKENKCKHPPLQPITILDFYFTKILRKINANIHHL